MNILRKGQVDWINRSAPSEVEFINKLFGLTVYLWVLEDLPVIF